MTAIVRPMTIALAAAAIAACTVLPGAAPQDIYRLPPASIEGAGAPIDVSLRVAAPQASDVLGSARIVVVPEGHRLSVYEGARWASPAPALWRDHLLDALRSDGRIARLSSATEGLQADVELGGTLLAFQAEYRDGIPEVVIRLDARLVEVAGKRIVASHRFQVREPAGGGELPAVVEAFGRANAALAREVIDWTAANLSAD